MNKRPEITAATRQSLIEAFCIVLNKKPIQKITIQEIVNKAGYNRCTFYKYFCDIYDILNHVEDIVIEHVKDNFQLNIAPDNFAQTFLTAFNRIQSDKAFYFDVLLKPDNQAHFVNKLIAEVSPIFIITFKLPPQDLKSKYLTEIYFKKVISVITTWINSGRQMPLDELSELLRDVLSTGVLVQLNKLANAG